LLIDLGVLKDQGTTGQVAFFTGIIVLVFYLPFFRVIDTLHLDNTLGRLLASVLQIRNIRSLGVFGELALGLDDHTVLHSKV